MSIIAIDKRTAILTGIGALALGTYAYKKKSATGKKLAMYCIVGALGGFTVETIGMRMILKR